MFSLFSALWECKNLHQLRNTTRKGVTIIEDAVDFNRLARLAGEALCTAITIRLVFFHPVFATLYLAGLLLIMWSQRNTILLIQQVPVSQ